MVTFGGLVTRALVLAAIVLALVAYLDIQLSTVEEAVALVLCVLVPVVPSLIGLEG